MKLDTSKKLGPQIDALIASNVSRDESLILIGEYLESFPEMKASAEQHYNSRPGHILKDGTISGMKAENGKSGGGKAIEQGLSDDEIKGIEFARKAMIENPFSSNEDVKLSRRDYQIVYSVLCGIERDGNIDFIGKALADLEKCQKEAEIERAMELLRREKPEALKDDSGMIDESIAFA